MRISSGKIESAQKVIVYGPEGIGKSTFAAQFPDPLFIDVEGGTKRLDIKRMDRPSSWTMLLDQVRYVKATPNLCKTLVIDTLDWVEILCSKHVCSSKQVSGIEDIGYGKGYTYLAEEEGKLLNLLEDAIEIGINVVIVAHAAMRKFEQPDEMGAYDRWELKMQKKTAAMVKEWADMVLFANHETYVVKTESKKNKAQGGKRVMFTTHHPCWDGKNRHGLPEKIDLDFAEIAQYIPTDAIKTETESGPDSVYLTPEKTEPPKEKVAPQKENTEPPKEKTEPQPDPGIPKALADLMTINKVTAEDIQYVVEQNGYYPNDTPIANYDAGFIDGVLIGAWNSVHKKIMEFKDDVPF